MRGWVAAALMAAAHPGWAAAGWVRLESERFELLADAREGEARQFLNALEQFRHAVAVTVGQPELAFRPPARVIVFKIPAQAAAYETPGSEVVAGGRTVFILAGSPVLSREWQKRLARRLIETNLARMPAEIEEGLVVYLSTVRIERTRIFAGDPPPEAERTPAWARVHLLATHPDFSGKLPILLRNLSRGMEPAVAYRNSLGVGEAEVEKRTAAHLAAGRFSAAPINGLPLNPERDFIARSTDSSLIDPMLAALAEAKRRAAEYEQLLADAAGSPESSLAMAALRRAIDLQPENAKAYVLLAGRTASTEEKIRVLTRATELDRRNAATWNLLAEAYREARQYAEAARAWLAAEQAETDPVRREALRGQRLDLERQRLEQKEADRRRAAEEEQRELEKLKAKAVAELRAAEAKANRSQRPRDPNEQVVEWWDGPAAEGKARGVLTRVDCLAGQARLHVQTDAGQTVRLLIRDPGQVTIRGKGELTLGCGPQKKRRIAVEYFPRPDQAAGTAGEVASIEFPE
jgi:tetratricopeptide (TPR) repeat protein